MVESLLLHGIQDNQRPNSNVGGNHLRRERGRGCDITQPPLITRHYLFSFGFNKSGKPTAVSMTGKYNLFLFQLGLQIRMLPHK